MNYPHRPAGDIVEYSTSPLVSHPTRGLVMLGASFETEMLSSSSFLETLEILPRKWELGPRLPIILYGATATVIGRDIYQFGGTLSEDYYKLDYMTRDNPSDTWGYRVHVLRDNQNEWKLLDKRLNRKRFGHVSVSIQNNGTRLDTRLLNSTKPVIYFSLSDWRSR